MSHISEMEKTPQTISFPCSLSFFFPPFHLIPEISEITPCDFGGSWHWSSSRRCYCSAQNSTGGDNHHKLGFVHRSKRGSADCTPSISTGLSTAQTQPLQTQMLQWMARKEYSCRQLYRSSQITAGKFVVTLCLNKSLQLLHVEVRSSSDKSVFVS